MSNIASCASPTPKGGYLRKFKNNYLWTFMAHWWTFLTKKIVIHSPYIVCNTYYLIFNSGLWLIDGHFWLKKHHTILFHALSQPRKVGCSKFAIFFARFWDYFTIIFCNNMYGLKAQKAPSPGQAKRHPGSKHVSKWRPVRAEALFLSDIKCFCPYRASMLW